MSKQETLLHQKRKQDDKETITPSTQKLSTSASEFITNAKNHPLSISFEIQSSSHLQSGKGK